MALDAGELKFTLQFAKDLKDQDWFGKQDPYCFIECGGQKLRSRTHIDGGRNPVWNETFSFQIINENEIVVTIMDEDTFSKDDLIGVARIPLAAARETRTEQHMSAPVLWRGGKQRGILSVVLRFVPNSAMKVTAPAASMASAPQPYPHPAPYPYAAPVGYGSYSFTQPAQPCPPQPYYSAPAPQYYSAPSFAAPMPGPAPVVPTNTFPGPPPPCNYPPQRYYPSPPPPSFYPPVPAQAPAHYCY